MKKRIFLLIVFFSITLHPLYLGKSAANSDNTNEATLTVISSDAKSVIFELTTPYYEIQPGNDEQHANQLVKVPGLDQTSEAGQPQLPMKGLMIGVPAEAEFTIRILDDEKEIIEGEFNIQPGGKSQGMIDDFQPGEIVYIPDETVYQSSNAYPESAAVMGDAAWIREQRVLQTAIYPFQYIPAEKTLVWHKRIRVEINFIDANQLNATGFTQSPLDETGTPSPFEAAYKSQLINYDDAKAWRTDASSTSIQGSSMASTNGGFEETQSLGPRYKIVVDEDGIYRLTYDALNSIHSLSGIDPLKLEMSNQGRKVAVYIENNNFDTVFDTDEAIIFYGQKYYGDYLAEKYSSEDDLWITYSQELSSGGSTLWAPKMNAAMLEKYTDDNVYWLTGTDTSWMETPDGTPLGSPVSDSYTTTVRAEQSHHWFTWNFSSEDTWFWDSIRNQITRTYTTTLPSLATTPFTATLSGEAVARVKTNAYNPDHHNKIWINSQATPVVDETWIGISRFHFDADIPSSYLNEGENSLKFRVLFDAYTGQKSDWIYFDWFEIEYSRTFQAENDLLQFERDEGGLDWTYQISNYVSSDVIVMDITDPLTPTHILSATVAGGVTSFEGMDHNGKAEYIVAGESAIKSPKSLTYYTPPEDFYDTGNQADYIFITQDHFMAGTQTLANYRASTGLTTLIVDFDDLVDEFNYGIYNPLAIKNFLRYAYANWELSAPSYVLLVGDGHWNFKNYSGEYGTQTIYMPPYLSWVDPEQGEVDTTNDLATIVGTDALPDIHIARLPVITAAELDNAVQKIMAYESGIPYKWKHNFLFVADNYDSAAGDFTQRSEDLIDDYLTSKFIVNRVFLDDYDDEDCSDSGDHLCIEATNTLMNHLNNDGALIVNYLGHGWNTFWASEILFMKEDTDELRNGEMLPILLSFTCRDGYWYHPGTNTNDYLYETSLAEALIRAEDKGVVSSFSPTGLGDVTDHDALSRGFYNALINDGVRELGAATLAAKVRLNSSYPNSDQIHSFIVFGDPALKIQVAVTANLPTIIK